MRAISGAGSLAGAPRLPAHAVAADVAEVEPWIETIIRLWDDKVLYDELRAKAGKEAKRWHPD